MPPSTPSTVALIKYVFLALAAAQFGIIKAVQKILPARSVEKLSLTAIITFALCESVAVLGLVLFLLAGNSMDFYIFMVISLGFFTLFFPKYDQWEQRVRAGNETHRHRLHRSFSRKSYMTVGNRWDISWSME